MDLQWNDNSALESGYWVEEMVGGTWRYVASTDASATSAVFSGSFDPSTEYDFRVQAFLSSDSDGSLMGTSLPSDVATATTPAVPAAPTDFGAVAVSSSEIDLAWTDNATGSGDTPLIIGAIDGTSQVHGMARLARLVVPNFRFRCQELQ